MLPKITKFGMMISPFHILHGLLNSGQGGHGSQSVSLIVQGLQVSHNGVLEKQPYLAVRNDMIRVTTNAINKEISIFFLCAVKFILC